MSDEATETGHMNWSRPKEIIFIRHGESLRNKVLGEHFYLRDAVYEPGSIKPHRTHLDQVYWNELGHL